jgi:hypothetical protein
VVLGIVTRLLPLLLPMVLLGEFLVFAERRGRTG